MWGRHHDDASSLAWLYTASLRIGYVPRTWKEGKFVPIPEPGKADYTAPKAYRPISLLPTIGKGLEKIVARRLVYIAEKGQLLPANHFGGRRSRSSEQALDVLVESIYGAWRVRKVESMVTFYVQGAFNDVHVDVLRKRLDQRGVHPILSRWVQNFCSDRSGEVVVG